MKKLGKQPITEEMRARFERLAPAALKRRSAVQMGVALKVQVSMTSAPASR